MMSNVPGSAHINASLAVLTAAGGVMGYVKSKSMPSLVAGLAIGGLYGASAYLIASNEAHNGHLLGAATSVVLAAAMARRYGKTRAMMPAGMMTVVGTSGAIYNGMKWNEWRH